MEADKRPSETENAQQLRTALQALRAARSAPPPPKSPSPVAPAPAPAPEKIKTFSTPTHRTPPPLPPKDVPVSGNDPLLPLGQPAMQPEEDPVERLRRLLEERRKQGGDREPRRVPAPPRAAPAPPPDMAPPRPAAATMPDEDPAARLRRLVDERRQKLAAERGEPPPPPVEPRAPFKPKPPQPADAAAAPASEPPAVPPAPSTGGESPAERLRRMLEEHKRNMENSDARTDAPADQDESPAERLAKMLEQRRRSNQLLPGTEIPQPPPPMAPLSSGMGGMPFAGGGAMPQPRDHLPPPEARKPAKKPLAALDPATVLRRLQETPLGRVLKRLGIFYLKLAGVVLWTALLLLLAWVGCYFGLNGFNLFSGGDWQGLQIRYRAGLTIPWDVVLTFGALLLAWAAGAVLVWRKGRPYVVPVLVVLAQLALLPVALVLALLAVILLGAARALHFVRTRRAKAI